jgi:hypothetical protein
MTATPTTDVSSFPLDFTIQHHTAARFHRLFPFGARYSPMQGFSGSDSGTQMIIIPV